MDRLFCACTFTKASKDLLDMLDNTKKKGNTVSDLKKSVTMLIQLHEEHKRIHFVERSRSLVELAKWKSINACEGSSSGYLQTSAFKVGDLKRLRDPPKKKSKKEEAAERKKTKIQKKSKGKK